MVSLLADFFKTKLSIVRVYEINFFENFEVKIHLPCLKIVGIADKRVKQLRTKKNMRFKEWMRGIYKPLKSLR